MSRRHHYKRKQNETPELDITTFLNLMVVLIPFLLITAVFSRITIMELDVPSGGGASDKPKVVIEVIVRKKGLEIGNGRAIVASIKKNDDKYDLQTLSEYLQKIKKSNPDKTDATVLMEPDIEYDILVKVMDAVRSAEIKDTSEVEVAPGEAKEITRFALFPDISVGDAP